MEIKLSGASAPLVQQLSIKGDWQTYRTITAADAAYDNLQRPKTLLTTTDPINCSEVDKVGLRLRSVTQGASLTYKAVVWGSRDSVTNAAPGQVVATGTLTTASDLDAATGNYISPYVSINPRWGRFLQVFVTAVTDIDTDHEGYLDAVGMSTDNEVNLGDITFKADVVETDVEAITGTGAAAKTLADVVSVLQALIPPDTSTSLPASTMICGTKTIADADVAEPLVDESTSCKAVWIGAPVTIETGAAANTKGMLVGNDTTQNFPIMPSNFEGKTFKVDDASNLYIKAGEDGESINYIIYQ